MPVLMMSLAPGDELDIDDSLSALERVRKYINSDMILHRYVRTHACTTTASLSREIRRLCTSSMQSTRRTDARALDDAACIW